MLAVVGLGLPFSARLTWIAVNAADFPPPCQEMVKSMSKWRQEPAASIREITLLLCGHFPFHRIAARPRSVVRGQLGKITRFRLLEPSLLFSGHWREFISFASIKAPDCRVGMVASLILPLESCCCGIRSHDRPLYDGTPQPVQGRAGSGSVCPTAEFRY